MTISQLFDVIAPELKLNTDKNSYIEIAQMQTSSSFFSTDYNYAVALRAAHIGTLASRMSGDGGEITGKREGDLSISYSNGGNVEGLMSTKYAKMLQELINNRCAGISIAYTDSYN